MAKKTTKSLRLQYTEAMAKEGRDMKDCRIVGFQFQDIKNVHSFHYQILTEDRRYYLFDGATTDVKIIIGVNDDNYLQELIKIAEKLGGKKQVLPID